MLRYITGVYMLVCALNEMTVSAQNCTTGWFGFNCLLKCHCKDYQSCSMDGQCPRNGPCETGYFGPACQYAIAGLTSPTPEYLLDNNDSSCNVDRFAVSVELTLEKPIPFSWYRIVAKPNQTILDINTKLNNDTPCDVEHKYRVSDNVMDVMCRTNQRVKKLKITGPIASSICSVYISAGRNVALKQRTYQTSNLSTDSSIAQAQNAVDGDTNDDFSSGSCSHSAVEETGPEWYLTYNRPMVLYAVRVYNRAGFHRRLQGFSLTTYSEERNVTNNLTAPFQGLAMYDLTLPSQSQVTVLRIKGSTALSIDDRCLTLCEVETYGDSPCTEDFYGIFCNEACNCSKNDVCSPILGLCTQGCPRGHYGLGCVRNCSDKCLDGYCKFASGHCIRCVPGFIGNFCTEVHHCPPGSHGDRCQFPCPYNCRYDACLAHSGSCLLCNPGYLGEFCDQVCTPGTFGINCSLNCSVNCAEPCHHLTGVCKCVAGHTGAMCSECAAGWYGVNCTHNCSDFCYLKMCDVLTGECITCIDKHSGYFCEVFHCPPGSHGDRCQFPCPYNCRYNACLAHSGSCLLCDPGYLGEFCDQVCSPKTFGINCSLNCSVNCAEPCHHITGVCSCVKNHTGAMCLGCKAGWYGDKCTHKCSDLCYKNKCDGLTGECETCINKHAGYFCEECVTGWFGDDCSKRCPGKCPSQLCDNITGDCMSCVGNRTGPKCDDCPAGYYGTMCYDHCSVFCKNRLCDKWSGACYACLDGYHGDYCNLEKEELYPPAWILPLLIPAVLLFLFFFVVGGGSYSSEEE